MEVRKQVRQLEEIWTVQMIDILTMHSPPYHPYSEHNLLQLVQDSQLDKATSVDRH